MDEVMDNLEHYLSLAFEMCSNDLERYVICLLIDAYVAKQMERYL